MLDLEGLPAYETSSEEGDDDYEKEEFEGDEGTSRDNSRGGPEGNNVPTMQYKESMKYI